MSTTITVTLPDDSTRELPGGSTVLDLATAIGKRLGRDALAGEINGRTVDVRTVLTGYNWDGVNLAELYYESPLG